MAGKWYKGMPSPNPGGKRIIASSEFARLALAGTKNGQEVLDFLVAVMRGKKRGLSDSKSRRWAVSELLDRMLGRAPQHINIAGGDAQAKPDYSVLTDAELAQLEALTEKLLLASAPAEVGDDGSAPVH